MVEAAAALFKIPRAELCGRSRVAWVSSARMKTTYLMRTILGETYRQIGMVFGAGHTVVMHRCQSVQNRIDTEPKFAAEMEQWRQRFLEAIGPQT